MEQFLQHLDQILHVTQWSKPVVRYLKVKYLCFETVGRVSRHPKALVFDELGISCNL